MTQPPQTASRSVQLFCTAHPCAQHTQRQTDTRTTLLATSLAIGCIYILRVHAVRRKYMTLSDLQTHLRSGSVTAGLARSNDHAGWASEQAHDAGLHGVTTDLPAMSCLSWQPGAATALTHCEPSFQSFVQLCSSWQDFHWQRASRDSCATAELLISSGAIHRRTVCVLLDYLGGTSTLCRGTLRTATPRRRVVLRLVECTRSQLNSKHTTTT